MYSISDETADSASAAHICLCMIVKNESRIIRRMLDSVQLLIDSYVICDTGSTDNTSEIIKQWAAEMRIPGMLISEPFRDFGYNRTYTIRAAKLFLNRSTELRNTYLLFLDADMVVELLRQFCKSELTEPHYMIEQYGSVSCYNTRLVRADCEVAAIGRTHEYYAVDSVDADPVELNTIKIRDIGDGGSKSDKFERDICLLTMDLDAALASVYQKDASSDDNISLPRTLFYLAQSYYHLGLTKEIPLSNPTSCAKEGVRGENLVSPFDKAIEYYTRRIGAGGWQEEIWYSVFMIGRIHKKCGRIDEAITRLQQAFSINRFRIEPLYELCNIYNTLGKYQDAYTTYRMGRRLAKPQGSEHLFIEPSACCLFRYEFTITARHVGKFQRGLIECGKMLAFSASTPQCAILGAHNIKLYLAFVNQDTISKLRNIADSNERISIALKILEHCRLAGRHEQAYELYKFICDAPAIPTHLRAIAEYEYTIIHYYLFKDAQHSALRRAHHYLFENGCPHFDYVLNNYKFYSPALSKDATVIDLAITKIQSLHSSTPSILMRDEGNIVNIRHVSYIIKDDKYIYNRIESINEYRLYDNFGNILQKYIFPEPEHDNLYKGVEDVRLITLGDKIYYSGVIPSDEIAVSIAEYVPGQPLARRKIKSPTNAICEKNWVIIPDAVAITPASLTREIPINVIYKWSPLTIGTVNGDQLSIVAETPMPPLFAHVRGSTNGIEINGNIWFIAHIVAGLIVPIYNLDSPALRHYYHIFVVFDLEMKLLRYSLPFTFEGERVEFCLGLQRDARDQFWISYSTMDSTSKIMQISRESVEKIML